MTLQYTLTGDTNGQSLTVVFSDGDLVTVPSGHAKFVQILGLLVDAPENDGDVDEQRVRELLDLVSAAANKLTTLSERVARRGNDILFDGDPVEGTIVNHIVRLLEAGDEAGWKGLVNFLENLSTNPEAESKASLYSWLEGRDFTITEDGYFLAYKGVAKNDKGENVSINSGTAFVDNVKHEGQIPNPVGAVVSMPRASVETDRRVGCSTGLHAGTWDYARWFTHGDILTVKINPRDVVSVPSDHSSQKLRVSRYTVLDAGVPEPTRATTYVPAPDETDDEYEAEDDDYGYDTNNW